MEIVVRRAAATEVAGLAAVERDGDRRYRGYDGIPAGFDDTVAPTVLAVAAGEGRLWVAVVMVGDRAASTSDDGDIVGFAVAETIDGRAHLAQLSVRLVSQGQGVGRRLVDTVAGWARQQASDSLTLCTFADVAWNRPLYEHLGFVVLAPDHWTPGLRAVFEADGDLGLDLSRRVVMALALAPSPGGAGPPA
jgi:GNAT superfamily N-acetyltransferase